MRKSISVAMDQKNGIGYQNRMPWHLPAELKRFKEITMGHHLIMGRKTYESIGRPLPGRTTIVVTRNPDYQAPGCLVAYSIVSALELAEAQGAEEVFFCGGSQVYREALELADRLYLTRIQAEFQTDTAFPNFDRNLWHAISSERHPKDQKNPHPFIFYIFDRKA